MSRKTPLTPDQVRQRLRQRGKTLTEWAADNGFDRKAVYRVMGGQDKGHYGQCHDIAVALGLKVSDSEAEPSTTAATRNAQPRKVA